MTAHLAGQRRRWQTWKCKHELTHMSLSVCVCARMFVCAYAGVSVCARWCVCMVNKHIWLHKALWLYLICTPQIGCCVCLKFFVARLTVGQGQNLGTRPGTPWVRAGSGGGRGQWASVWSRVPWHRWMAKPCPGPEPEKLIWKQLSNLTMKINNSAINTKRAFWIMQATFSHQRSEVFKLLPSPAPLPFTPWQLPAYCSLLCCCPAIPLLLLLLLLFPFSLSAFIAVQLYIHCEKTGAWSKVTLERSCSRPCQLSIQYSSSKDQTAATTTTQL